MRLALLLLLLLPQDPICRKITGCHKEHPAARIACPKCEKRRIPGNDAACHGCAAKRDICRHCGLPRKRKAEKRWPSMEQVAKRIAGMKKEPSVSIGTLRNSTIRHAAELPVDGIGYRISSPKRKANFGTDEMVFGLMELGARMHDLLGKDGEFLVGDISKEKGGKLSPHINHQGGRDVDIGLFILDAKGRPTRNRMVTFDKDGWSKDKKSRFDAPTNWAFVVGMIENTRFRGIRAIYLADWLKELLLSHARKVKADPRLIADAERLISQPRSSPHANHYHLSLLQTKEDRKAAK